VSKNVIAVENIVLFRFNPFLSLSNLSFFVHSVACFDAAAVGVPLSSERITATRKAEFEYHVYKQ